MRKDERCEVAGCTECARKDRWDAQNKGPLTKRQAEVWVYVHEYREAHGYSPSVRDVTDRFRWVSTNATVSHYQAIARKGFMRLTPRINRSVVTIGDPEKVRRIAGSAMEVE